MLFVSVGVFDAGFWNVTVEYAKSSPQDLLCRYTVCNQSTEAATLHVLPTLWFRSVRLMYNIYTHTVLMLLAGCPLDVFHLFLGL